MIVKIDRNEVEAVKKICTLANTSVNFYTIEQNDLMVQVEITELDGRELTAKDAWHIARSIDCEIEMSNLKNK